MFVKNKKYSSSAKRTNYETRHSFWDSGFFLYMYCSILACKKFFVTQLIPRRKRWEGGADCVD